MMNGRHLSIHVKTLIAARERVHAVNVTRFVDFVGKASASLDRLHKLRADQAEEPLALPPGTEIKSLNLHYRRQTPKSLAHLPVSQLSQSRRKIKTLTANS